jgi:DNA (cytosine-5)-methyltransferase 1
MDKEKRLNHPSRPGRKVSGNLREEVIYRMFPTPQANEDAAGTPQGKMQRMLGNCEEVRDSGTGVLNPNWVEWLMGYPSGWTDLKVSETQLSRTSPISSESDLKNYAKKTKPKNISPKP